MRTWQRILTCPAIPAVLLAALLATAAASVAAPIPTTLADFELPGSQPDDSGGVDFDPIVPAIGNCSNCHVGNQFSGLEVPMFDPWRGSMMHNAVRDPLFHACLTIANQDASQSGDLCIRCHAPGGWLAGRSTPTDASSLGFEDWEGITCNFCHRLVDPVYKPGISPTQDQDILDELNSNGVLPVNLHSGVYVVDPVDSRRGPLDDITVNFHNPVEIIVSPFHLDSALCASCHDVSNPAFTYDVKNDRYLPNAFDTPHPTGDKYDMFPVERTYSEWLQSEFATTGVDMGGVFGGDHPTGIMSTCQDCHMPVVADDAACAFANGDNIPYRDVRSHDFNGGNTWAQDMIANLYPWDVDTNALAESKLRARYMLQNASVMAVTADACNINVTVTNQTGHKLPSGYPEGRRMWITVEWLTGLNQPVATRGYYDDLTADLTTSDTKVYEAKLGLDALMAATTGLPEGESFHFVLNNTYVKDNRIPPRGFTNAGFAAIQASPVDATYADGQYWDETTYRIPPGASKAAVSLWYQAASKEYITFLRDENMTNTTGLVLYEQWEATGMSPPLIMEQKVIMGLTPSFSLGDFDCDSDVDLVDHQAFVDCATLPTDAFNLGCTAGDFDLDGDVDLADYAGFQQAFSP